ncbi:MAG: ABC transporter substrate-binding protein [Armatimonadota bacterium]|nr:ABC transporter substrate-binding protein [Armatimonadota bacterium]MDR7401077.1 ABC transporter substrate-binding protein [Armatimonadota bacterium]MDR7403571.1 ABC transporter substrate-binding protein [Armatimonadota bacterium]MDR7436372.1 ABC transporter substrate-binding protein [Armatimonadota bacterium]MDR7471728.1 ABC transporter substrate-binding protein [Armatimonadota bacterium]
MSNGASRAPWGPVVVAVIVAALVAGGAGYWAGQRRAAAPAPEERKLEIFHWWTAGGEREAADAMFQALREKYPDIQVVENPVAGGGGVSHRVVLQARLSAGIPPDTWQTLGGAELKSYVDGGYLTPLDDLYAELNYADAIPKPLLGAVTIDGHPYVVPLNMHIQNILYYNKKLFDELRLTPPTTVDELLAVARAIKAARPRMAPLALGTKEKWEAAFVLDSILLEEGGPEYYVRLYKGEVDVATDPTYRRALERLAQLAPYIYPFHAGLTWDESCGLVVSGDSAMVLMGTWAIGYFKSRGWEPGRDFGAVTFPQKPDRILLFHPDTYGLAKGAPHPRTTRDWLRVVASPELQVPTDVTQGGLFARLDIEPSRFPDPIRQELQTFVRANPGKLILDQHGSIAPFSFTQAYWDVAAAFTAKPDVSATVRRVAELFTTYNVRDGAAWYRWP